MTLLLQVPGEDEEFFCMLCRAKRSREPCVLCRAMGGAMTTVKGGGWVHLSCVFWHEKPTFENLLQLENVVGCDRIDAAQRKLVCYLCGNRGGAPVQCSYGCCRAAYHVTCAMLAGMPLISKEEEKDDSIVMKSFCHKHGPRFCFRGRWVIDPKKTFVEQVDVLEAALPTLDVVTQLLASVIEHSAAWAACNSVLSLGYTGAYFSAPCISSHIASLKQLSPDHVAALLDAYIERASANKFPLLRQFSHAVRPLYTDHRLPRDMAFKGPRPEVGFHVFRGMLAAKAEQARLDEMESAKREAKKSKFKDSRRAGKKVYTPEQRAQMLRFIESMWPIRGQLEKFRTLAYMVQRRERIKSAHTIADFQSLNQRQARAGHPVVQLDESLTQRAQKVALRETSHNVVDTKQQARWFNQRKSRRCGCSLFSRTFSANGR